MTPGIRPLPVSVLTGFLGAGKTSLLNRLLKLPLLENAAVIVNEFGEIGIDHLLVETADEDIFEMSSGCLCCTIRGDLANTLEDLLHRRDNGRVKQFDRVVIETTGLANPAPILHTFMSNPALFLRFRLDGVITVVDGLHGMSTLDRQPEAIKQVAVADRLVLSKTDLCQSDAQNKQLRDLTQRLTALNPGARVVNAADSSADLGGLFNAGLFDGETMRPEVAKWLNADALAGAAHHAHDVNRHDGGIRAFCLIQEAPIGEASLSLFFELLCQHHGDDLLRCKGIVKLEEDPDRPVVIHGVQHMFHPAVRLENWPDKDRSTRIVFIVRNIEQGKIEAMFRAFAGKADRDATLRAFEEDDALSLKPKRGLM